MVRGLIVITLLAGCTTDDGTGEVVGPFTGTPRRFVVDSFRMPTSNNEARALGGDLDGDKTVDNQLGQTLVGLGAYNVTTHSRDMVAAGALTASVIVHADNLVDDGTVSVTYYGSEGAPATRVAGRFIDGMFISNRTPATETPGEAIAHLPVFIDADPSVVPLLGIQLDLERDGDGYLAWVNGGIPEDVAMTEAARGLVQLFAADPSDHRSLMTLIDTNHDYAVTIDEVTTNSLIISMMAADVSLQDRNLLSFGFQMHLTPCAEGSCLGPPTDHCHDRVKDADESDIDCGGSCRSCKASEACNGPADCDSNACDAGACRAPSCSNGIRDGVETDVDCGGSCGSTCAIAQRCWSNGDCLSHECGEPCLSPDALDCVDWPAGYDVCHAAPP